MIKSDHIMCGLISGSSILLTYMSIFMLVPYCFNDYSFIICIENRSVSLQLCSSLSRLICSYRVLLCCIWILQLTFYFFKECYWTLYKDCIESIHYFGLPWEWEIFVILWTEKQTEMWSGQLHKAQLCSLSQQFMYRQEI